MNTNNKIMNNIDYLPLELQEQILMFITHPFDSIQVFKRNIKLIEISNTTYELRFSDILMMTFEIMKNKKLDIYINMEYFRKCSNLVVCNDVQDLISPPNIDKLYLEIDKQLIQVKGPNGTYITINNSFEISLVSIHGYLNFSGFL